MTRRLALLAALAATACAGDFAELVPPTVDDDPALAAEDVNGTRLHVQTFGTPGDPVVIVLHGGPGHDHRSMLPLTALADDYFVVVWDQRGTGLSRRHGCDELTADHYLGDLEALVDRYAPAGGPPLFLVGHSWGAMYATWFIHEHPDRVRAAVLVEPGGFTRAEVDDYFGALFTTAPLSEAIGDALWTGRVLTPDDHARADLMAVTMYDAVSGPLGMSATDPMPAVRGGGLVASCMPPSAGDFDWTPGLDAYPGEVLFLHGDQNRVLPRENQQRIAAHYGRVTIREIPGTGHDLHWVARDQFVALTRAHLDAQLEPGDAP